MASKIGYPDMQTQEIAEIKKQMVVLQQSAASHETEQQKIRQEMHSLREGVQHELQTFTTSLEQSVQKVIGAQETRMNEGFGELRNLIFRHAGGTPHAAPSLE